MGFHFSENTRAAGIPGERQTQGSILNALLNCASGAKWVSLHHDGGVGYDVALECMRDPCLTLPGRLK